MKRKNVYSTLGVLTVVAALVLFVPLPYRVMCPLELKPRDAQAVYVQVPGVLRQIDVKAGQKVNKDQELAVLNSVPLQLEIAELQSRVEQDEIRLKVLSHGQLTKANSTASLALPALEKALDASREMLEQRLADRQRLTLVAPAAGTVLPPPSIPKRPALEEQELPTWSGSPLEQSNLGAYLEPPALYCQIGDPTKWEVNIVIDQDEVEFVHEQQEVKIKFDSLPGQTFDSTIIEIGPEMKYTSRQMSSKAGGDLMSKQDASGVERPMSTSYQARAAIDDSSGALVQGMSGTARISADWQPLGKRAWRWLMRTFNFRL